MPVCTYTHSKYCMKIYLCPHSSTGGHIISNANPCLKFHQNWGFRKCDDLNFAIYGNVLLDTQGSNQNPHL